MNNILSEFSSPLKPKSRTLLVQHCASWLHFIQSRRSLLTSWTNESGPCNLVSEALEMKMAAVGKESPTLPACHLVLYCYFISKIFIQLSLNCCCTAPVERMLFLYGKLAKFTTPEFVVQSRSWVGLCPHFITDCSPEDSKPIESISDSWKTYISRTVRLKDVTNYKDLYFENW
jgi:hypothetical protein